MFVELGSKMMMDEVVRGILHIFNGPSSNDGRYYYEAKAGDEPDYDGPWYGVRANKDISRETMSDCLKHIFDLAVFFPKEREVLESKALIEIRVGSETVYIYKGGVEIEINDKYGVRNWLVDFLAEEVFYQGPPEAIFLGCSFFKFNADSIEDVYMMTAPEWQSVLSRSLMSLTVDEIAFWPKEVVAGDEDVEIAKLRLVELSLRGDALGPKATVFSPLTALSPAEAATA